jgi:hypothetical protein
MTTRSETRGALDADRRARRVGLAVTLFGLVVLGVTAAVAGSWHGDLPDPVAVHWGVGGTPDSFASLPVALIAMLGLGAVLVIGFGAVTAFLGQTAANRRVGAATTVWIALMLAILQLGTLHAQRGAADPRQAEGIGIVVVAAIVGALIPAVLVGLLLPGDPPQPTSTPVAGDAPRVPLGTAERATWIGHVNGGFGVPLGVGSIVVTVVLALITGMWPLLIVSALLAVLVMAMSAFVIRVDTDGLTVRSALRWPRTRVPLAEVLRADVVPVDPLREFGGWGWRVGRGGRVGIILRKGEGLLVERTGGRSIVVTVDDAATGAALLNTLADRSRSTGVGNGQAS